MISKKTVVLGASTNPSRYSFLAINKLMANGHAVIAIGNKKGTVKGVEIRLDLTIHEDIDTITLYLNPTNQKPYYDYILAIKPKRIIFNPGTENEELEQLAQAAGIATIEACTLVMLSTGQY
jgi:uncharacterized protein